MEAEVEALFTLTIRAYGRFAFLKPMMRNKVLLRRINRERKDEGFARLRNWLYWALVLELNKICSDDDKKTPSIKRITEKLKDDHDHLRKQLEDKYAKGNADMDEAELRAEFNDLYSKYLRRAKKLLSSQSVGGYKTIRNKLIAHNELRWSKRGYDFRDVRDAKVKYGDERRLLSKLQGLVKLLLIIVREGRF